MLPPVQVLFLACLTAFYDCRPVCIYLIHFLRCEDSFLQADEQTGEVEGLVGMSSYLKNKDMVDTFNIRESGIYYVGGLTQEQGLPQGAYQYGIFVVFVSGFFVTHVYFPDTNDKGFYIRVMYGDVDFRPWQYFSPNS